MIERGKCGGKGPTCGLAKKGGGLTERSNQRMRSESTRPETFQQDVVVFSRIALNLSLPTPLVPMTRADVAFYHTGHRAAHYCHCGEKKKKKTNPA